jgi:hypothetical protein
MTCGEDELRACRTYLGRIINECQQALDLLNQPGVTHFHDSAVYIAGAPRQSAIRRKLEGAYEVVGAVEHHLRTNINKAEG